MYVAFKQCIYKEIKIDTDIWGPYFFHVYQVEARSVNKEPL